MTEIQQYNSDIAQQVPTALTIGDDQQTFTEQQIAALQQLGIDDAPRGDIDMFFHQAKRTGLDPFAKQIYMIGRRTKVKEWDESARRQVDKWVMKYTIQVGIDGFRLVGQRIADAQGLSRPIPSRQFCGKDGQWSEVWLGDGPPAAAKGIITVGDFAYESVVLFREYAATYTKDNGESVLTGQWRDKPATMIGKCAEAAAWRAAFPHDFSSLYEAAEMDRHQVIDGEVEQPKPARRRGGRGLAGLRDAIADAPAVEAAAEQPADAPADAAPTAASKAQCNQLANLLVTKVSNDQQECLAWLSSTLGRDELIKSTAELTADEADQMINDLAAMDDPEPQA